MLSQIKRLEQSQRFIFIWNKQTHIWQEDKADPVDQPSIRWASAQGDVNRPCLVIF